MQHRKIIMSCVAVIACAATGYAGDRTIEASFPANQIDTLSVTNGVGDFFLNADDGADVRMEIILTPRRGGIFSSMKRAEEDVAKASLVTAVEDGVLRAELEAGSGEPRFEARWRVIVPSRLALALEQGVGDVEVTGLAGGIEVELGVGSAEMTVAGGDVAVSVGVGNGTIRGPASLFASAVASGGVGGAVIEADGEVLTGEGFVSHSSSWRGGGPHDLELEVGVGDARIVLE